MGLVVLLSQLELVRFSRVRLGLVLGLGLDLVLVIESRDDRTS